jgi:hypothetical protein
MFSDLLKMIETKHLVSSIQNLPIHLINSLEKLYRIVIMNEIKIIKIIINYSL